MFVEEIIAKWVADGIPTVTIFSSPSASIPSGDGPYSQINETGGMSPMNTQDVAPPAYQQPGAQCVAIAKTQAAAYARSIAMYNSLVVVRNMTLSGTWYMEIIPSQEPFSFPVDALGRARVIFNIRALKRPS